MTDRGEPPKSTLRLAPITKARACAFIFKHHRHSKPVGQWICGVALEKDGDVCGVAILEAPKARCTAQKGNIAEITRCCTDGTKNACSMLYGAMRRAASALGYDYVITYTLASEGGASLRSAGFAEDGRTTPEGYARRNAKKCGGLFGYEEPVEICEKVRWISKT